MRRRTNTVGDRVELPKRLQPTSIPQFTQTLDDLPLSELGPLFTKWQSEHFDPWCAEVRAWAAERGLSVNPLELYEEELGEITFWWDESLI